MASLEKKAAACYNVTCNSLYCFSNFYYFIYHHLCFVIWDGYLNNFLSVYFWCAIYLKWNVIISTLVYWEIVGFWRHVTITSLIFVKQSLVWFNFHSFYESMIYLSLLRKIDSVAISSLLVSEYLNEWLCSFLLCQQLQCSIRLDCIWIIIYRTFCLRIMHTRELFKTRRG